MKIYDSADIDSAWKSAQQAQADGKLSHSTLGNLEPWLTLPHFDHFRCEILQMIQGGRWKQLEDAFWEIIAFGTGGRRGRMGELGTATMNARTVAESAYGLGAYFMSTNDGKPGTAVIAHDSRNRSTEFAKITASVFAAQGFTVYFFSSHRSTPELSFAVRYLKCDVGVVISASHNPPSDNGFKAYWSYGGQVLAPHDKGIVDHVYKAKNIPMIKFDEGVSAGKIKVIDKEIDDAYVSAVLSLSLSENRDLKAIYTPLHGVGETCCYKVLMAAGFKGVEILEEQRAPDGNFPNVDANFPNPERPEVFKQAIARAKQTGAYLIMASDPDADRLGVCVLDKTTDEFVHLTGNRIGALIADYIISKRAAKGDLTPEHYVVETLVTTPLIGDIARTHGLKVVDNLLVGFKYIGQTMDQLGADKFVFGAEESLGYLAGGYARDKDAGIASLYIAEHAAELHAQGKTLLDRLDELALTHGYYLEGQISKTCPGADGKAQIVKLMAAFRRNPPLLLAGIEMASVEDYGTHEIRTLPTNAKQNDLPEPKGDLMIFDSKPADTQIRLAVRPSGTEPKIKFYLFAKSMVGAAEDLEAVKRQTQERLTDFQNALSTWMDDVLAS